MLAFLLGTNLICLDSLILGVSSGPILRQQLILPFSAMFGLWGIWAFVLSSLMGPWVGLTTLAFAAVVVAGVRPGQLWMHLLPLLSCIDNLVTPPPSAGSALRAALSSSAGALVGLVLGRAFLPIQWARPAVLAAIVCVILVT